MPSTSAIQAVKPSSRHSFPFVEVTQVVYAHMQRLQNVGVARSCAVRFLPRAFPPNYGAWPSAKKGCASPAIVLARGSQKDAKTLTR